MQKKMYKTEQEEFWAGEFGNEYQNRNNGDILLAGILNFLSNALKRTDRIKSCIEFGSNIGLNLKGLKLLYPNIELSAIEINKKAISSLKKVVSKDEIFQGSILDYTTNKKFELTLIKGVLIHINPDELNKVYKKLVESTNRYLLVAEYYNPTPVSVSYRGNSDKLFKRDFAGEIMDQYKEMRLIDYGFNYHRDRTHKLDDITWFLMEKIK